MQQPGVNIEQILDTTPRLRAWADIGPVQRAEVEQFAEALLNSRVSAVTADGVGVNARDQVWVLSSLRYPTPTTVKTLQAYTNYMIRGDLTPVAHSFSTEQAALNYQKHKL